MTVDPRLVALLLELRGGGVTDVAVLNAIERTPRELFVPEAFRDRAYENAALPIARHQTVSQPLVVGLMTQALNVGARHKVLEVGTGSGYHAAVLAQLCRRLYTMERFPDMFREAEARFQVLRLTNVTARAGDGTRGWPQQAPFDRILVAAAAEDIPQVLVDQLGPGGIMVLPVGDQAGEQHIVRVRRTETGVEAEHLQPVRFVPLIEGDPAP
jgi:protein-L-isoaspartate(D-aspartate) O-methyltransferase